MRAEAPEGDEDKASHASLRDPDKVKMAYTPDSIWRNRDQFLTGRDEIKAFLTEKWKKEHGYRLRKELFAFTDHKVQTIQYSPLLTNGSMPNSWEERES